MLINPHHPTVAELHDLLFELPTPRTYEDMLCFVAQALDCVLSDARLLFYLADPGPDGDPLSLIPCPARPLVPGAFVYDHTSDLSHRFSFKTEHAYYTPLALASHSFGYLLLEVMKPPLGAVEQGLTAMWAMYLTHLLNHLGQLQITASGCPDAPVSLEIDQSARLVRIDGVAVSVSKNQLSLFQLLYERRGQVCEREMLYQQIYEEEGPLVKGDNRLNCLVSRLRDKLSQVPDHCLRIEPVPEVGYRLIG